MAVEWEDSSDGSPHTAVPVLKVSFRGQRSSPRGQTRIHAKPNLGLAPHGLVSRSAKIAEGRREELI